MIKKSSFKNIPHSGICHITPSSLQFHIACCRSSSPSFQCILTITPRRRRSSPPPHTLLTRITATSRNTPGRGGVPQLLGLNRLPVSLPVPAVGSPPREEEGTRDRPRLRAEGGSDSTPEAPRPPLMQSTAVVVWVTTRHHPAAGGSPPLPLWGRTATSCCAGLPSGRCS